MTVTDILIVGAGSCVGGMTRYAVSHIVQGLGHASFPWGTFVVNVVGCFVIGLVYGLLDRGFTLSEGMRLFLTVGFCGGFTTFSTFMHENYLLFTHPNYVVMALYVAMSVAVGFLMVYVAYWLVR